VEAEEEQQTEAAAAAKANSYGDCDGS
jgi:hypothetical protein